MLEKANLTAAERFQNLFAGKIVIAIEPDTGVKLVVSRGRRRRGSAPNYILIVRASCNPRIRAWTDEEAIELANARLAKMRSKIARTGGSE